MDFAFSDEQRELGDLTARILADRCTHERLSELEAAGGEVFDRDLWRHLAEAGVLGAVVPEEHGGAGLGLLDLLLVLQATGEAVAPVPLVPTLVLGALPLVEFGSDEQRARWLPRVVDGSVVLTAALDGPGDGSAWEPTTRGDRDGDRWTVTGTRTFVPYGHHADRVLVPAATEDGVGTFLVDPTGPGVATTDLFTTNRQPAAHLELDAAPAELLVEDPDAVRWIAERGAAANAVVQAGVCRRAVRMAAEHTSKREQFGKPLAEFQAVAQRAADAFVDATMVELTAHQALFRLAQDWPASAEVHVAAFWAGDGAMRVVHAAQHLHGGLGVDLDYPLHRYFLMAKQLEHAVGTPTRELVRLGTVLADEDV